MGDIDKQRTWRERARITAERDILSATRGLLAQHGVGGVSIRAVARELGMSSPALYRYFASLDELVEAVAIDVFGEMAEVLRRAARSSSAESIADKISDVSRALRAWSLAHPYEFQLTMMTPRKPQEESDDLSHARYRLAKVYGDLFVTMWETSGYPQEPQVELNERAKRAVAQLRTHIDLPVPDATALAFLSSWVRLGGAICMEVVDQLSVLGTEAQSFFELELIDVGRMMGMGESGRGR